MAKSKYVQIKGHLVRRSSLRKSEGIYFTPAELDELANAIMVYQMFLEKYGNSIPIVLPLDFDEHSRLNYILETGLGSAAKKIWKKLCKQKRWSFNPFKDFVCHRDGYKYPSFDEWSQPKE